MLTLTMLFESKCCKSCCRTCCCHDNSKKEVNSKYGAIATDNTPLLTDTTKVMSEYLSGDLLASYPPRNHLTESV